MEMSAPVPRSAAIALAALSPVAIGAIVAAQAAEPSPVFAVPAIVFGVVAATSPALYIATAATGDAPPLATMARAFGIALGAFGVALAGLVLPAAFLSLSSIEPWTTLAMCTAAVGAAAVMALRRLASELGSRTWLAKAVYVAWAVATLGIGGRLWWDVAREVLS